MAPENNEPVDMSPAVLRRRLEQLRALYKLMIHLRQAKVVETA